MGLLGQVNPKFCWALALLNRVAVAAAREARGLLRDGYLSDVFCEPPETRLSQTGILDSFWQTERRCQKINPKPQTLNLLIYFWGVFNQVATLAGVMYPGYNYSHGV